MAYYMYCPLDLTVKQQHIYTLLYNQSAFKDNFRVPYTVQQLTVDSDKCFGMTERIVSTIIKQLISKGYLKEVVKGKKGFATVYEIQVNFIISGDQCVSNVSPMCNQSVSNSEPIPTVLGITGNQSVSNVYVNGNQCVNPIIKEKKKDKEKKEKTFPSDSVEIRLAEHLFSRMKINNPTAKEPNLQVWAHSIDLMMRVDGRTEDEIVKMIDWCQKHKFWFKNILSTDKLRKQYDRLIIEMNQDEPQKPKIDRSRRIS